MKNSLIDHVLNTVLASELQGNVNITCLPPFPGNSDNHEQQSTSRPIGFGDKEVPLNSHIECHPQAGSRSSITDVSKYSMNEDQSHNDFFVYPSLYPEMSSTPKFPIANSSQVHAQPWAVTNDSISMIMPTKESEILYRGHEIFEPPTRTQELTGSRPSLDELNIAQGKDTFGNASQNSGTSLQLSRQQTIATSVKPTPSPTDPTRIHLACAEKVNCGVERYLPTREGEPSTPLQANYSHLTSATCATAGRTQHSGSTEIQQKCLKEGQQTPEQLWIGIGSPTWCSVFLKNTMAIFISTQSDTSKAVHMTVMVHQPKIVGTQNTRNWSLPSPNCNRYVYRNQFFIHVDDNLQHHGYR